MNTGRLDSAEAEITITASPTSVWVENPAGGTADLELVAKDSGGTDICSDKIHFYPFTSIVVLFEGEGGVPSDPPVPGLKAMGISTIALNLYLNGYDVHNYEDSPSSVGLNEIQDAVTERDISNVALIGYSHGGGSVYQVSESMPASCDLKFTAYIDAVKQPLAYQETRRPLNSSVHYNYYQIGSIEDGGLDGGEMDSYESNDVEINFDDPEPIETHLTIDDKSTVINGIQNYILNNIQP